LTTRRDLICECDNAAERPPPPLGRGLTQAIEAGVERPADHVCLGDPLHPRAATDPFSLL
jgi:hypothetical protein